jgi:hypothetical protein
MIWPFPVLEHVDKRNQTQQNHGHPGIIRMNQPQLVLSPADREECFLVQVLSGERKCQHAAAHMPQEQIEREVRGEAQDEQRKDDHCFCEE